MKLDPQQNFLARRPDSAAMMWPFGTMARKVVAGVMRVCSVREAQAGLHSFLDNMIAEAQPWGRASTRSRGEPRARLSEAVRCLFRDGVASTRTPPAGLGPSLGPGRRISNKPVRRRERRRRGEGTKDGRRDSKRVYV